MYFSRRPFGQVIVKQGTPVSSIKLTQSVCPWYDFSSGNMLYTIWVMVCDFALPYVVGLKFLVLLCTSVETKSG